jgi:molybdenum cofactor cytidylyltransferase
MISGVVLAAGTSSRLGRPKQLLDLGGRPVLQHVVDAAVGAGLDEVVIVLGHAAREVASAVPPRGRVRIAVNPDFAEGQSSSLKVGLRAVDQSSEAVVILLGDQPGVRADAISAVVRGWREGRSEAAAIVQASYGGRPAHPTLIGRPLWTEVGRIGGDQGARALISRHPERRQLVEVDGDPPDDIDTEEDYRRVREAFNSEAGLS